MPAFPQTAPQQPGESYRIRWWFQPSHGGFPVTIRFNTSRHGHDDWMIVLPGGALSDKATEFGVVQIQFFEIPRGLHASNQKKRIMKMLCSTYIFWICSYVRFCFEDKRLRRPVHALHVGLIPGLLCPPSLTQEAQLWRTDLR